MINRAVRVAMLFLFFTVGAFGKTHQQARPLSLKVEPVCAIVGQCSLRLTIENTSDRPLHLYESLLPWKPSGMLIVACESLGSGQTLEPFRQMDDPDFELVELAPGESATGSIDLNQRFRGFADSSKRAEIAVFWLYRPSGKALSVEPIIGGVLLPRLKP